jgi:large subunit ribosomal protein L15
MIKLHQLKKRPSSTKSRKVVGRGLGSGHGTYSTRGGKGQTARSGHSKMPAGFEGGRQPLIRQIGKGRGFKSLSPKATVVALDLLNVYNDGDVVTIQSLVAKGLVKVGLKGANPKAKILDGKISKKLTVKVPVSEKAKAAIEKAGGSVVVK